MTTFGDDLRDLPASIMFNGDELTKSGDLFATTMASLSSDPKLSTDCNLHEKNAALLQTPESDLRNKVKI